MTGNGKKVAFLTLGCKVNMYDTEAMTELFLQKGYDIVDFEGFADIYIINTCTVTNFGDKKSRQMIRRAKRKNPLAIVVATGCYAQVAGDEVAEIDGVNIVIGTKSRKEVVEIVENYKDGVVNAVSSIKNLKEFENTPIESNKGRTRAYVKIQDGCNRYCTYCIIPYARGNVRSRDKEDILKEVKVLAEKGFKEVVLTGIHVASYGLDKENIGLADVVEAVHDIEGIERIRFSSMEPKAVTEEFVERMKALPKVCDHYHLSLQSGCNETLKRMNRRYTAEEYLEVCERLRAAFPNVAITTDIIVGFPGESEEDFKECVDFAQKVHLDKIHVFPYSPKKGTPAAKFQNQIKNEIKSERSRKLIDTSDELNRNFLSRFIGKTMPVLFETTSDGYNAGHTSNYIKVLVKGSEDLNNKIIPVKITSIAEPEVVYGVIEEGDGEG
ncbi:MAG: tRNA (N(6)-L-threonylcarbamoyladenosine(37)-C(2))-methylthiotransferase MtaB [Firmicutes bacterium]|nr:tRNA (N(6)-L-threonylcarbamoyladenosine(37)-C(2))-methylthiotransferase MtaB [Bacillota bacterium]